jgi:hypothetical protein
VTARKRRAPRTVLDTLEVSGIVEPWLAKYLRQLWSVYDTKPEPLVGKDVHALEHLLGSVMAPAHRRVREAQRRAAIIAFEHALYIARGETAATSRTAKRRGISERTVSQAVRQFPNVKVPPGYKRDPVVMKIIKSQDGRK